MLVVDMSLTYFTFVKVTSKPMPLMFAVGRFKLLKKLSLPPQFLIELNKNVLVSWSTTRKCSKFESSVSIDSPT